MKESAIVEDKGREGVKRKKGTFSVISHSNWPEKLRIDSGNIDLKADL